MVFSSTPNPATDISSSISCSENPSSRNFHHFIIDGLNFRRGIFIFNKRLAFHFYSPCLSIGRANGPPIEPRHVGTSPTINPKRATTQLKDISGGGGSKRSLAAIFSQMI